MNKLSTAQLSRYLSVTRRTVQRRAAKEKWVFEEELGLGGVKRLYVFSSLPEKARSQVVACIIALHDQLGQLQYSDKEDLGPCFAEVSVATFSPPYRKKPTAWISQHCFSHEIDKTELNRDYIKMGLLSLAKIFAKQIGLGKIKGFDQFCQQYNERHIQLDESVYRVVNRISRITLLRWEKKEQEMIVAKGIMVESQEKQVILERELLVMAEEVLMIAPNISAKRLRQHFLTFFNDKRIPNERQLTQWMKQNHPST